MFKQAIFYSVLIFGSSINSVHALNRVPPFSSEMTPKQVLALAGPPKVRIEKEIAREEVWEYEGYQIVFREGKLSDWTGKTAELKPTPVSITTIEDDEISDEEAILEMDKKDNAVAFDEILDALPKDADPGGQPTNPVMIDPEKEMGVTD